jgi:DNA polymerase/3'-5' exonuclease PolX
MPVHNAEIAAMFDQAAELMEIKGDNPFRCRAYRRAADVCLETVCGTRANCQKLKRFSEATGLRA